MQLRRWLTTTAVLAACGRAVDATDAGTDSGDASLDGSIADAGLDGPPYHNWDATPFDGFDQPIEGEFPPTTGKPCELGGLGCADIPGASCDLGTGWCCSGDSYSKGRCMCGQELGCQPPAVCCPQMGQQAFTCAGDAALCAKYAKDQ